MLDMPTIVIATYCTAVVQGLLLLFFWMRSGRRAALGLSGAAFMLFGGGFAVLGGRNGVNLSTHGLFGGAAIILSGTLFVAAARKYRGGYTPALLIVLPAALWSCAYLYAPFMEAQTVRATLLSTFMSLCFTLSAAETWRWKQDGLTPRRTLMGVALVFAVLFGIRAVLNRELPYPLGSQPADDDVWFALAALAVFVLLSMVAFLAVGMASQRIESDSQAIIDPVTGALRRGAFFLQGARMVNRHHEDGRVACLALLHLASPQGGVSDEALRIFARAAAESLKTTDLMARMNGEQFAVLLSDASIGDASDVINGLAGRVSRACAAAGFPTFLRAGLVSSTQGSADLRAMVVAADSALKRARFSGEHVAHYFPAQTPARRAAASG